MTVSRWTRRFFVVLLALALPAILFAAQAQLPQKALLFPQASGTIQDPAAFYNAAAKDENLLLLQAAIFDPIRDGAPKLDAWVPDSLSGQPLAKKYYLVQFKSVPTEALQRQLTDCGANIVGYIPNNALLVRMNQVAYGMVSANAQVRWIGDWQPAYKIPTHFAQCLKDRTIPKTTDSMKFSVEFFPLENVNDAVSSIVQRYAADKFFHYTQNLPWNITVTLSSSAALDFIQYTANRNDVRWVGPRIEEKLNNDNTYWMCQSGDTVGKTAPVFAKGIFGNGQIIAVCDSGITRRSCFFLQNSTADPVAVQHVAAPGALVVDNTQRKLVAVNVYEGASDDDVAGAYFHGTHTSGTAAGKDYASTPVPKSEDGEAFASDPAHLPGDGMAPSAKLIMEGVGSGSGDLVGLDAVYPYYDMWDQEYNAGARLATNSWGGVPAPPYVNVYLDTCFYQDLYIWEHEDFLIFFSAGNSGIDGMNYNSLAKNDVSVGATDRALDGANNVTDYSGKGPAGDGRYKPDLCAPGGVLTPTANGISSARGSSSTAVTCNRWFMSGTSMAAPAAAGLAALVREYFVAGWYPTGAKVAANTISPSGALVKATMINSCANVTGNYTGSNGKEDAPAGGQGWGRILLDNVLYFAGDARKMMIQDVPNSAGVSTGDVREYTIQVAAGQPLKVTLAWTDPPAVLGTAKNLVNDLDLEVEGPAKAIYRGNQWNGNPSNNTKESLAGAAGTDSINNVEGVLLRAPSAGTYTIRVKGTSVPGYSLRFTQGYALVITGDLTTAAQPSMEIVGIDVDDSGANGNHVLDPGEQARLNVRLGNYGTAAATGIMSTLTCTTPGITVTQGSSMYPNIAISKSAVNSTPFTLLVASDVPPDTPVHFTLSGTVSGGYFSIPFTLRVLPVHNPVMTALNLAEGPVYETTDAEYPQYIWMYWDCNYADPQGDYDKLYLYTQMGGQDMDSLPVIYNIKGSHIFNGPSGWTDTLTNPIFIRCATSSIPEGTLKAYGYLTDSQGNWSAVCPSNEVRFLQAKTSTTLQIMDDDDTCYIAFPTGFTFPFYGRQYSGCWVNSDGNIGFTAGYSWMDRSPAAFLSFMPRIAPLYTDLAKNPNDGKMTMTSTANTVTFSWIDVKQWAQTGPTGSHTFEITLNRNGAVDIHWGNCSVTESQADDEGVNWRAVVGVNPGGFPNTFPMSDLSSMGGTITLPAGEPVWQGFRDTDMFDLANSTIHFVPADFTTAQTLIFPRISYQPGVTSEGLGFLNPTGNAARIRLSGYGLNGSPIGTQSTTWWPVDAQSAIQAESALGLTSAVDGWAMAECDQVGVRGFYLSELLSGPSLTGLDGANAFLSTETVSDGVFPRVKSTGGFSTQLFIANPGTTAATVTLTGLDGATTLAAAPFAVPAKGAVKLDVATVFGQAFDGAVHLTATGANVVGNSQVRYGTASISSCNLLPTSGAATSLAAAHIATIPDVYFTEVNLYNPNATAVVATLSPYKSDGTAMVAPFTVNIPAGQVLMLSGAQIGLPVSGIADGWLKITGDAPLTGCLTFGKPSAFTYVSTLPLESTAKSEIYFSQVANGIVGPINYFSGITMVNPNAAYSNVVLQVFGSDGRLYGQAQLSLRPYEKIARILKQLEGIGLIPDQASGYIRITASQPIFGFELFGDWTLSFLSAVAAQ